MKPQQLVKMVAGALVTLALVTLGSRTLAEFQHIPMPSFVVLGFAFGSALVTRVIFGAAAAWFANVYRSRISDRKKIQKLRYNPPPCSPITG
jgi:hypothetical protein